MKKEASAKPRLNASRATVIFLCAIIVVVLLPVIFSILSTFFPEAIGSRTLLISATASLVLLLPIFVYSFREKLKFCVKEIVIMAEYFAVRMLATFTNHIRPTTSLVLLLPISVHSFWENLKFCLKEIVINSEYFAIRMLATFTIHLRRRPLFFFCPVVSVIMLLITGNGIRGAIMIASVIFLLLTLFVYIGTNVIGLYWDYNDLIIMKVNSVVLPEWTVYCQHLRPARIAVKHQIFIPAVIVMVTLITEGAPPSVTSSLTAVSVVLLRLLVKVPSYNLMVDQPCSYWISVLICHVLKPVLIVVLPLIPVLSEKRILVTGIIVIFVQFFQIPSLFDIILPYHCLTSSSFIFCLRNGIIIGFGFGFYSLFCLQQSSFFKHIWKMFLLSLLFSYQVLF